MENYNSTFYTGALYVSIYPATQEILAIGISIILFLSIIVVTGIIVYYTKKNRVFVSNIINIE